MKKVVSNDLHFGLRVQDEDGNKGTIIEYEDLHNVFVDFDNGGFGLFCFISSCERNEEKKDPLYVIEDSTPKNEPVVLLPSDAQINSKIRKLFNEHGQDNGFFVAQKAARWARDFKQSDENGD